MSADPGQVIVSPGVTRDAARVHHRDFPEIRSDGESPRAAARHLANRLLRTMDSAPTDQARAPFHRAVADIRAFVEGGP